VRSSIALCAVDGYCGDARSAIIDQEQEMPHTATGSSSGSAADRERKPPVNTAAWMKAARGGLDVAEAPYPVAGPNQIVVRNHAVAVNPL